MARKGTGNANQFSRLLNAELRAEIARQRISLREIEEKTGISRSRISVTVNRDEAPINTNELDLLTKLLGVKPSNVLASAEAKLLHMNNYALTTEPEELSPFDDQDDFVIAAKRSNEPKGVSEVFE